ncbi:RagB/SusD family nutrient uptake outer membrane protein [uncultured Salegentibacter sp.]|uniref:RagB/SusD family nutrient uptake outer membrane protein n=1 Tax=uncultured Salegentibacter sp. TaxID=259320 RepID=UPI0025969C74|nr:RagB/SusD family nutrient uptake outer membrane protein [uncultured Salegentibacter sp.]
MKIKIQNILLGLFSFFSLTSCEPEWLEETTSLQIRAEEQFESEEGFKDALIGTYIGLTSPNLYAKDLTWNLVDILGQQHANLPSLALYSDVQQFEYRTNRSTPQIDMIWQKAYNTIANINIALDYMDKNSEVLHPLNYNLIKGELLGLRAFLHFDLLRLYGLDGLSNRNVSGELAIPYILDYSKDITPLLTYSETFDLLEKDLNESLELLKNDPIYSAANVDSDEFNEVNRDGFYDNREQRMNYYAVRALQARVLQWQGGSDKLSEASLAAQEVIDEAPFNLINSESYNVSNDPILYPEILFSLDVTGLADMANSYFDASSNTNYDALFYTEAMAADIFETQNVNIGVADVRYNTLLNGQTRGLVSTKIIQRSSANPNQVPLIKLPEMYYVAAEASINSGELDKAAEYLNDVRFSRGILEPVADTLNQQEMQLELMKEYRKEFISEGQLFYFYKRNGLTQIPGVSETVIMDEEEYVLPIPDNEIEFGNR